jgi:hypothetical protein
MTRAADLEQAERRKHVGSTGEFTNYRDRAFAEMALEAQGRHALAAKAEVIGKARVPLYPRMPAGNPWTGDQVGVEPPLGYAINDLEITGEHHEVEESLLAASSLPQDGAADAAREVDATPSQRAAPVEDLVSSSTGVTPTRLTRGRKL